MTAGGLAVDFAGTYTLQSSSGPITLVFQPATGRNVNGSLSLGNGLTFRLQGELDEDEVIGQVMGGNRNATFEAFLEDGELYFTMIPHDASGNPDFSQAQEYVFSRSGAASAAPAPAPPAAPGQPAAPPSAAPGGGFGSLNTGGNLTGNWYGTVDNQPGNLELSVQGGQLSGRLQSAGYTYTLRGTASGQSARGQMIDQAGRSLDFELVGQGSEIQLHLKVVNSQTGAAQRLTLNFSRNRPDTQAGAWNGGQPQASPQGQANAGNEERDPALVGSWSRTDSISSGSASMSTQYFLQINPDGSYVYSIGRSAGGGGGWGMESGPGESIPGRWKTSQRIVYIQERGVGQWIPYARYYVEGNRLMLTFDNGNREIWYR
jgi:hypothetical protein